MIKELNLILAKLTPNFDAKPQNKHAKDIYAKLMWDNIRSIQKAIIHFYKTDPDYKPSSDTNNSTGSILLPKEDIEKLIYHFCLYDPREAGETFYKILLDHKAYQLETSAKFITYGATLHNNDRGVQGYKYQPLHIAITMNMPIWFIDKILECSPANISINTAINRVYAPYYNAKWNLHMKMAFDNNIKMLSYLIEKSPNLDSTFHKIAHLYTQEIEDKPNVFFGYMKIDLEIQNPEFKYDARTGFGNDVQCFTSRDIEQAKLRLINVSLDILKKPKHITKNNQQDVMHLLRNSLRQAVSPSDYFDKYKILVQHTYESNEIKNFFIFFLQESVFEYFASEKITNSYKTFREFHSACEQAVHESLFADNPSEHRDRLLQRYEESEQCLKPQIMRL